MTMTFATCEDETRSDRIPENGLTGRFSHVGRPSMAADDADRDAAIAQHRDLYRRAEQAGHEGEMLWHLAAVEDLEHPIGGDDGQAG